jgi:hypothetical protein
MDYSLIIKDISSEQAILQDQDSNLVYLPKDKLPENLSVGQTLNLQINFDSASREPENILAKEILNEILGGKS